MNGFSELAPVTIASAFLCGVILALLGSIKLPLAERLAMDEAKVGGLLAAFNLALIPLMLVIGILIDQPWLGLQGVLAIGFVLSGLAIFGLGMSATYSRALGALLVLGAGFACLSTVAFKLMPKAFFEDRNAAAAINLGNVFFGLGALLTPSLAELLIVRLGLRRVLSLLAIVCLGLTALALLTARSEYPSAHESGSLGSVLVHPVVWLCGLVFFLYAPLEGSVGAWATTYLKEVGFTERRAPWLLSGFWLTFMAARLVTAIALEGRTGSPHQEAWLILILALVAAVLLGNLSGTQHSGNAAVGLLLVGAVFGPIFPTLCGLLYRHFEENERGTAYGAMFSIGAMGGLLLPPLIGIYAKKKQSVRLGLRIPALVSLLLAAATLFLVFTP